MKINLRSTTQVNKPKIFKRPYAPQTPDTNNIDLGRPTPKVIKSKRKKVRSKK